jgi:uncharacterized Zn finger protein
MEQKLTINLKDAETLNCEQCENTTFVEAFQFKKVSKLMTGSMNDGIVPFPIYKCDSCGHINSEFARPE